MASRADLHRFAAHRIHSLMIPGGRDERRSDQFRAFEQDIGVGLKPGPDGVTVEIPTVTKLKLPSH